MKEYTVNHLVCEQWRKWRKHTPAGHTLEYWYSHYANRTPDESVNEYGFTPAAASAYDYAERYGCTQVCNYDLDRALDSLIADLTEHSLHACIWRASQNGCYTGLEASTLAEAKREIENSAEFVDSHVYLVDAFDCVWAAYDADHTCTWSHITSPQGTALECECEYHCECV